MWWLWNIEADCWELEVGALVCVRLQSPDKLVHEVTSPLAGCHHASEGRGCLSSVRKVLRTGAILVLAFTLPSVPPYKDAFPTAQTNIKSSCSLIIWCETTLTPRVDTLKTCVFMHLVTLYGCEHGSYACFVICNSIFKRESIWDVLITAGTYEFLWMFATD